MGKNHNTIEFRRNRAIIMYLWNYKCAVKNCKSDSKEVHHDNRDSLKNELINLVPLCKNCHSIIGKTSYRFNFNWFKIVELLINKISDIVKNL